MHGLSARLRPILRGVLALLMVIAGVAHFANPGPFMRIVPAWLPAPYAIVLVSGVFEILGGAGLLMRYTRRAASYGLIALLLAVFPANINQAIHHISFDDAAPIPPALLWGRLPFQILFIAWAWWVGRDDP